MALAARLASRSRQLYSVQAALVNGSANQVRSFAKNAPPAERRPVGGDELLKGIFSEVKNKFDVAIGVLKKERIIIDPDDPKAVSRFAEVWNMIREKAGFLSDSLRIKNTIATYTQGIPDVRTYLNTLSEIRKKHGVPDELGIEPLFIEALDKIEKDIKKPLLRSDKKNVAIFKAECDKITRKFGFSKEDLPKLEKELELDHAKFTLTKVKEDIEETVDNLLKREEFKDETKPDIRNVDIRKWL